MGGPCDSSARPRRGWGWGGTQRQGERRAAAAAAGEARRRSIAGGGCRGAVEAGLAAEGRICSCKTAAVRKVV